MPRFDPGSLPSRVLFQDAEMLIIDKPAGLPVHKGPGGGETLEDHFGALRFDSPETPALAHRLDKDTSGCLVLGRSKSALARLGRLFRTGGVKKSYWAVVAGSVAGDNGIIDVPLARRSDDRRSWWMKVDDAGDPSLTRWEVLGRADGLTWLELQPETGRTHQLRVHCAHMGTPIAGDAIYGGESAKGLTRNLHLHARHIALPDAAGQRIEAIAAPPDHMQLLLSACGWQPT
jgi:tRNA pseudouridine32 synthase / 23S rRNA pseudouridine746 synthase